MVCQPHGKKGEPSLLKGRRVEAGAVNGRCDCGLRSELGQTGWKPSRGATDWADKGRQWWVGGGVKTSRDVMKTAMAIGCGGSRGDSKKGKVLREGNPSSNDRSSHSDVRGRERTLPMQTCPKGESRWCPSGAPPVSGWACSGPQLPSFRDGHFLRTLVSVFPFKRLVPPSLTSK